MNVHTEYSGRVVKIIYSSACFVSLKVIGCIEHKLFTLLVIPIQAAEMNKFTLRSETKYS